MKALGEGNFELASVHVSESHRRRGIGSNLVRQLVKDFVTTHGPEQVCVLGALKPSTAYILVLSAFYSHRSPERVSINFRLSWQLDFKQTGATFRHAI